MGYRGVGRDITDRKRSEQVSGKAHVYLAEAEGLTQTGQPATRGERDLDLRTSACTAAAGLQ
jgi:hypothetical protein